MTTPPRGDIRWSVTPAPPLWVLTPGQSPGSVSFTAPWALRWGGAENRPPVMHQIRQSMRDQPRVPHVGKGGGNSPDVPLARQSKKLWSSHPQPQPPQQGQLPGQGLLLPRGLEFVAPLGRRLLAAPPPPRTCGRGYLGTEAFQGVGRPLGETRGREEEGCMAIQPGGGPREELQVL